MRWERYSRSGALCPMGRPGSRSQQIFNIRGFDHTEVSGEVGIFFLSLQLQF